MLRLHFFHCNYCEKTLVFLFALPSPHQMSLCGMTPKFYPLYVRASEACVWIGMDTQPQQGIKQCGIGIPASIGLSGVVCCQAFTVSKPPLLQPAPDRPGNQAMSPGAGWQAVSACPVLEQRRQTKKRMKRKEPGSEAGPWLETDFHCSLRDMI